MVIVAGHITVEPRARRRYALGVGSRVRHRRCAAPFRGRHGMDRRTDRATADEIGASVRLDLTTTPREKGKEP